MSTSKDSYDDGLTPYEKYYVYSYRDYKGNIVYVGHGCKGRAWHCGYMRGDTEDRQDWKEAQLDMGRLPCDWVKIEERRLSKADATDIEREMIKKYNPEFNIMHRTDYPRTKELRKKAKELRESGKSYSQIGILLDKAPMTVWRYVNGE